MNSEKKLFTKSAIAGGIIYLYSISIANLNQFYILLFLDETIRTDINILITFTSAVFLNFILHNNYVFKINFDTFKLFQFYGTNILNLLLPFIFWNIYESFFGSPSIFVFNLFSVLLVLILIPLKFLFYKKIFKN